ncbi:Putative microfibrillar-associated protein [Septoria linicola]|uniref:Microfibrillar-associated protein n=1 Tax=Septoria linicola TaxID=215465 RepID=A0A9Q9AMZ7_9PEZI|nr:putative microfibrillar-associated protein [Septoria linicola]USW49928.1 Putative microfibrillar-associated protein [Septoria linicola]
MPPPSSRMTKQPVRPARFFPGKAVAEDPDSEEESDEEEEVEQPKKKAPPPKAASFPKKLAIGEVRPAAKVPEQKPQTDLEGFETASESEELEESGSESGEEGSSEEEDDSSSDDEPKKPMLAPKFISKAKRAQQGTTPAISEEQKAAEEERLRKEKADALLQAQIERDIALKKAGKKNWDDEDVPEDEVDDTDGLDPEAEKAAWKLRELKRVQRDRNALIEKEKMLEEIERRRNMTEEERAAEDAEKLAQQEEDREGRGQMGHMQKYFHKGAFFDAEAEQDEEVKAALTRSLAGRKFVDEASDKSVLPEYMQIRDATKLGKKGRTKYKDLRNEDTGRWGTDIGKKKRDYDGLDDRFKPDDNRGSVHDSTGANSAPLGERRRREDDGGRRDEKRPRYD